MASLKAGEVVVDLGAGGGLDVFLAASRVGPTGRAIGVDMTPAMVTKARETAKRRKIENVEFRLGEIENLPVANETADVIISNCVINLVPVKLLRRGVDERITQITIQDKARAFQEMFRVLKHGGRVAISDIALKVPALPESLANDVAARKLKNAKRCSRNIDY